MKVVVHCGMSKTGSTLIQDTFARSRGILAQHGVYYPALVVPPRSGSANLRAPRTHHSELITLFLDDDEYLNNFGRGDAEKKALGVALAEDLWSQVDARIEETKPETLFLSSEYIAGMRPQSLVRLTERLRRYSDDIEFVIYLREPRSHFMSRAQQVVKYGATLPSPNKPYKFCASVGKFLRTEQKTTCLPFLRDKLRDGSVLTDIWTRYVSEEYAPVESTDADASNQSLSAESMFVLAEFNSFIWGKRRIVGNSTNKALIKALAAEERHLGCKKAVMRKNVAQHILDVNFDDLVELNERHGVQLLSPKDLSRKPPPGELNEVFLDRKEWRVEDLAQVDKVLARELRARTMARLINDPQD